MEKENEETKKKMKKGKEVFHEWEHLNMHKLLEVIDVLVVQVVIWTRSLTCPLCATTGVSRAVKVPQIQFIAGIGGHSSSQQRRGCTVQTVQLAAWCGVWRWGGLFSRSSRSSGVERQFSEPSMMKSSLSSRAPAQLVRSDLST